MDRTRAIRALQAQEQEIRAAGVVSASLFGSTARNKPDSRDVDVAVRLADSFSQGGLDYFGRLDNLESQLSRMLGCRVDVEEEPTHKQRLQDEIERDRVIVF